MTDKEWHGGVIVMHDGGKSFTVNTNKMTVGDEYIFRYETSIYQVSIDKDRNMKLEELA